MKNAALVILLWTWAAQAAEGVRRIAVVVGANSAPAGRQTLRFSHRDAQAISETLQQVSGFAPDDVKVLLDPEPSAVLAAIDAQLAQLKAVRGETLLLFYYSGHADETALYPNGKPMALEQIKARLERGDATVRLGILDSCRGGGWTRAKGLTPGIPFAVETPLRLSSEGSVLVASSSGAEDAHETDALQSSFFTHHLIAALRGAAERTPEGDITLNAAFAYARDRTVHDTAIHTRAAQHPSFDINLRGRQDLTLAQLSAGQNTIQLEVTRGPLQLIALSSGLTVLELAPGPRAITLAVAPGRYAIKRAGADGTFAHEFLVQPGATASVSEAALRRVDAQLASKSVDVEAVHLGDGKMFANRLAIGIGATPFDPWSRGFTLQAGVERRFGTRIGWELLRGFWNVASETTLRHQLVREFSVPTAILPPISRFVVETRAIGYLVPQTRLGSFGLQLELFVAVGVGAGGIDVGELVGDRTLKIGVAVGGSIGVQLGWRDRVALRLEVLDHFIYAPGVPMNVPQGQLSVVVGLGDEIGR